MALDLQKALNLRRFNGWASCLLLTGALLCLADGLTAGFKGEGRILQAVPGMELPVTAPMPPETTGVEELRIQGQDPSVLLEPEALYSGFWLGGSMWRGKVIVAPQAVPGERVLSVLGPPLAPVPKPPITIRVAVHADSAAMQAASPSMLTRLTGREPFPVGALLFALALPGIFFAFWLGLRVEALMAEQGQAVISLVKRDPQGVLIHFQLGRQNGLAPGDRLSVTDSAGRPKGLAEVQDCSLTEATATLRQGSVMPGDIVCKTS